ncbi:bifunctional folylpolyglutamate synthase/dihydrofolate synthase [Luteolibacter sp. GHJ8]|uniref:Dihydrofolate synthase/folylpolyglutamate synthase n=1 Tax=Luteolibacter rhizosphaerae TaxID=2989719 RepID=A0ABT3G6A7_9BACT|nr:folylpolyglutamate synthase/dihydrofolate synthase family protein [Luteolibacter rhizosphaerae]MCW1915370.1 bifunctional folylpolyglutamate synthase/dihydrofolate synthase [Luteolibacter rhizosphaerae]
MTYQESIDWLFSTQLFGIKLGLEGPRRLLKEYLAYPDHGVKVIHVAGTNGKGSTCAMIDAVSRSAGNRTGLFTSPHLIDFRERIRVSGNEIPEVDCAAMLTELRGICEGLDPHPTFFEITLALAMRWFRERDCEVIVLETGMGGRLDATTAVPADVCAITPIGLDHMQWLGETIEQIAAEKAGIFVEGKPAISAPQEDGVRRVLKKEANERRSPLSFIELPLEGYPIALPGLHQRWNAALAVECLHAAGIHLDYGTLHHGLSTVRWPGRFEVITYRDREVILDGAHNPQGAEVLVRTWREQYRDRKAVLVFSAVAAKDVSGILALLAPLAAEIHLSPVDTPRALPTEEIAASLPPGSPGHECHPSFDAALGAALRADGPILIAGSLFLVGEAKAKLQGGEFQASTQ